MKAEVDYALFYEVCAEVCGTPEYLSMKQFIAHADVSVYAHSILVAKRAYAIAVRNKIKCDIRSLVRGALLHDFFLYDWHKQPKFTFHGFKHAKIARKNAEERYGLNEKEKNIIESHMFPLNLFHFPRCKEAWIVTLSDKLCAIKEITTRRKAKRRKSK